MRINRSSFNPHEFSQDLCTVTVHSLLETNSWLLNCCHGAGCIYGCKCVLCMFVYLAAVHHLPRQGWQTPTGTQPHCFSCRTCRGEQYEQLPQMLEINISMETSAAPTSRWTFVSTGTITDLVWWTDDGNLGATVNNATSPECLCLCEVELQLTIISVTDYSHG